MGAGGGLGQLGLPPQLAAQLAAQQQQQQQQGQGQGGPNNNAMAILKQVQLRVKGSKGS